MSLAVGITNKSPVLEIKAEEIFDPFRQESLKEMYEAENKRGCPFYVTAAVDEAKNVLFAEAGRFLRNYLDHGKKDNPLTRKKIVHYNVYLYKGGDQLELYCDQDKLRKNPFLGFKMTEFDADFTNEQRKEIYRSLAACYLHGIRGAPKDPELHEKYAKLYYSIKLDK